MFNRLKPISRDEIFSLKEEFAKDTRQNKVNGGIGVYLDTNAKPYIMPVVKKAIKCLDLSNFNYLPISGDPDFLDASTKLTLGNKLYKQYRHRLAAQGIMGGTNGLYTWGLMIKKLQSRPQIIVSSPTWENQANIYKYLGFKVIRYSHLDKNHQFNFLALLKTINKYPKAHLLFHGGLTHNPTGVNPSKDQWLKLAILVKKNKVQAFFDQAYLGLGQSLPRDSFGLRYFISQNIPTSVNISFSKIMSLYQHRAGLLFTLAKSPQQAVLIEDHYQDIFRKTNSNPAALGEILVKIILTTPALKKSWLKSLAFVRKDLSKRRQLFAKHAGKRFYFVTKQYGLYSLLGLSIQQVNQLKNKYAIYLLSNSRINFGGLSYQHISYVAQAILDISK